MCGPCNGDGMSVRISGKWWITQGSTCSRIAHIGKKVTGTSGPYDGDMGVRSVALVKRGSVVSGTMEPGL